MEEKERLADMYVAKILESYRHYDDRIPVSSFRQALKAAYMDGFDKFIVAEGNIPTIYNTSSYKKGDMYKFKLYELEDISTFNVQSIKLCNRHEDIIGYWIKGLCIDDFYSNPRLEFTLFKDDIISNYNINGWSLHGESISVYMDWTFINISAFVSDSEGNKARLSLARFYRNEHNWEDCINSIFSGFAYIAKRYHDISEAYVYQNRYTDKEVNCDQITYVDEKSYTSACERHRRYLEHWDKTKDYWKSIEKPVDELIEKNISKRTELLKSATVRQH